MLNALRVIVRNGSLLLFVILQIICFYWIINYNQKQKQIYNFSTQWHATKVTSKYQSLVSYFNLKVENEKLKDENAGLLKKLFLQSSFDVDTSSLDSLKSRINIISATIIDNSVAKRNNMITLDKGILDGVDVGMGVVSSNGVVGIITDVSDHFSLVMSLLHSKSRISCQLPHCGFFGTLVWNGLDPNILQLEDIQRYADVRKGDSIVTSGYSIVFPKNILVGTVKDFTVESGSFSYTIQVIPNQSFFNLSRVYIINHVYKEEKEFLEKKADNYE